MKNRLIVVCLMGASLALGALGMLFATGGFRSGEDPGMFATMRDRTSIRRFDPSREVSEEDVEKILRAGMCAPTALNRQPWAFVVVRDPGKVKQLGERLPGSRIANGARAQVWGGRLLRQSLIEQPTRCLKTYLSRCSFT